MDGYESNRREFLKKLGLIAGTAALTTVGGLGVMELITDSKEKFTLTEAQQQFMTKYEKWLDAFHAMAKFQKQDPEHLENNKTLMALSEEASKWQKELVEHMKDPNFARYYMVVTERVTKTI